MQIVKELYRLIAKSYRHHIDKLFPDKCMITIPEIKTVNSLFLLTFAQNYSYGIYFTGRRTH